MMLIDIENDLEYIKRILNGHRRLYVKHRDSSYKCINAGNIVTFVPTNGSSHVAINTRLKKVDDIDTLFSLIIITCNGLSAIHPYEKALYIDGTMGYPGKDPVYHHEGLLEIYSKFSSKYKALINTLVKDNKLTEVQVRYNSERKLLEVSASLVKSL